MTPEVARQMVALNTRFYAQNAVSFGQTRQSAWPGGERCLDLARDACPVDGGATLRVLDLARDACPVDGGASLRVLDLARDACPVDDGTTLRVLDLACGNLRFARFLAGALPVTQIGYRGVDNCPGLSEADRDGLPGNLQAKVDDIDVISCLLADGLGQVLGGSCYDLVVCFGFMHHVPTGTARARLLRALLLATRPGGLCCVSFWRFMANEHLATKARATTTEALDGLGLSADDLDSGDYLLGWQGQAGAWRYCHHFDEAEVDGLLSSVSDLAQPVARFQSDGRTSNLNSYLVLRRT